MKKFFVTGGAGFIGANITHTLVHAGYHVDILAEKNTNYWRLKDILPNAFIHEIDLIDFTGVTNLIKKIKPEVIIHLASYGGTPDQQDQQTIYDVNLSSTINLLNSCIQTGFECFINTGSSSEYGKKTIPMKEDLFLEPISDYAVSKSAATHFCLKEAHVKNLPIYTIRPFSVYGDYEMPKRLIPTLLSGALTKQEIKLSNPKNVRDFIYIEDLVNLYLEVERKRPTNCFVINGGTGVQSSIHDVVMTLQACCDYPLNISWGKEESRPWEPTHWRADITLAKEALNWKPHYTLSQGIRKSLVWFRNHIEFYSQERVTHDTGNL
jgi:nucleoside-diphosphate-sugar epimerase